MIQIPLSQITSAEAFRADVDRQIAALKKHQMGKPGVVAPAASLAVSSVIGRQPQPGPVDKRGPDQFVVLDYVIIDDIPVSPEVQVLRDSING